MVQDRAGRGEGAGRGERKGGAGNGEGVAKEGKERRAGDAVVEKGGNAVGKDRDAVGKDGDAGGAGSAVALDKRRTIGCKAIGARQALCLI